MSVSPTYLFTTPQTRLPLQQEKKHSSQLKSLERFIFNGSACSACAHFAAEVLAEEKISEGLKIAQCFHNAVNKPMNKDFFSPLSQEKYSSVKLGELFQNLYNFSSKNYIEGEGLQSLRLDTLKLLKEFLGFDVKAALKSLNEEIFFQKIYEEMNIQLEPRNKAYLQTFLGNLAELKNLKEGQKTEFAKALFAFLKELYKKPNLLLKKGNFQALFIVIKKLNPNWDPKAASKCIKEALPELKQCEEREEKKRPIYSEARMDTLESLSVSSDNDDHFKGFEGVLINEEKGLKGS